MASDRRRVPAGHGKSSPRILIVDDDRDIAKLLRTGLGKRGYRVTTFNDPEEALSSFRTGLYDQLIPDIGMPKMTGFDLFRELRKTDPAARVCFFTAFEIHSEEFHTLFPEPQSDCFLRTPVSIAEFAGSVEKLLGEQRAGPTSGSRSRPASSRPGAGGDAARWSD